MAKSLRSKVKRRFRSIKRRSTFAQVETARTQRLAAKQAQTIEQQTNSPIISSEPQKQPLSQHTTESAKLGSTDLTGSLFYEILGLIDPEIIDSTNIEGFMSVVSKALGDKEI